MTNKKEKLSNLFLIHRYMADFNNLFKVNYVDTVKEIKENDFIYHLRDLFYVEKIEKVEGFKGELLTLVTQEGNTVKRLSSFISPCSENDKYKVSFDLDNVYLELKDIYEFDSKEEMYDMLLDIVKKKSAF